MEKELTNSAFLSGIPVKPILLCEGTLVTLTRKALVKALEMKRSLASTQPRTDALAEEVLKQTWPGSFVEQVNPGFEYLHDPEADR